jgi:hypothetical protein
MRGKREGRPQKQAVAITLICLHGGHGDCRGCGCECHGNEG